MARRPSPTASSHALGAPVNGRCECRQGWAPHPALLPSPWMVAVTCAGVDYRQTAQAGAGGDVGAGAIRADRHSGRVAVDVDGGGDLVSGGVDHRHAAIVLDGDVG